MDNKLTDKEIKLMSYAFCKKVDNDVEEIKKAVVFEKELCDFTGKVLSFIEIGLDADDFAQNKKTIRFYTLTKEEATEHGITEPRLKILGHE